MELQKQEYKKLIDGIGLLLLEGREKAAQEVINILVQTYWEIGRYIVEFEQRGNEKAEYGSQLFDRLSADQGHDIQQPEDLLKDPFVLEFLNIPEKHPYLEGELEEKLISDLQQFLLELGKGFAFIARQYRMSIGGKHFRLDLLFYHRILKCFVLIDLKRGELDHSDVAPPPGHFPTT